MAAKSNDEVKEVIAKSIADAANNPGLSKALSENHLKILSQPPYDLTLEDLIAAHDTHPNLRPAGGGPWGGGQTTGKGDRDLDEASAPWGPGQPSGRPRRAAQRSGQGAPWDGGQTSDQGPPWGAGPTSGKGPRRSGGGQSRGGGHRGTRG
jgi:hypothetical protein